LAGNEEAKICTLRSASLLLLFRARAKSVCEVEEGGAGDELEQVEEGKDAPPSSSHTRNSLPRVLTLTALPRGVISALDTDDVWPQSFVPGVMERFVEVEVHRYNVRVLSGCVAKIYGWEYDSVVGREFALGAELGTGDEVPEEGEEDIDEKPWGRADARREDVMSPVFGERCNSWSPIV
jgi:hypothetical protein